MGETLDVEAAFRWLERLRGALASLAPDLSPQERGVLEFLVALRARKGWKPEHGSFTYCLAVLAYDKEVSLKPKAPERALATLARPNASVQSWTIWARALKDAKAIEGSCDARITLRVGLHADVAQRKKARNNLLLSAAERKRAGHLQNQADKAWADAKRSKSRASAATW